MPEPMARAAPARRSLTRRLSALGAAALLSVSSGAADLQPDRTARDGNAASALATPARQTRWTFTMPRSATTSAGVYTLQGRLVRTLWRGEPLPAGPQERLWDGRDDQGQPVAAGEYEILLVHHAIQYVWEGVIGNSSTAPGGSSVHKAYLPPSSLAIAGDRLIYAVGYNEQQPGLHGFMLDAPQVDLPFRIKDPFSSHSMVAADAKRLYWANTGGLSPKNFIGVYDLATNQPSTFTNGRALCLNIQASSGKCYEHQDHRSVIDVEEEYADAATGLAVQHNGRVLAVAHGSRNVVRLFDKTSGQPLGELAMALNPKASNQLAMSASGDLWVISGTSVLRYTDLERRPTLAAAIRNLARPLALAATPRLSGSDPVGDDAVWVADGGTSQQLKRFDRHGVPGPVIGRPGGYATDPQVAGDRLCFKGRDGREQTGVAAAADGSVWVIDYCNNRMLRFPAQPTGGASSDAQVAYLPGFYASTVDHGDTRRVFANFLEFEVDVERPLTPGLSWRLVRNWLGGLPAALTDANSFNAAYGGFQSVETLSNGRTFGLLQVNRQQVVVELPAAGPLQVVKVLERASQSGINPTARTLYENGDLGHATTSGLTQTVFRQPLTGFDGSGRPVWQTPVRIASAPVQPGTPGYRCCGFSNIQVRFPVTASGRVVFFDPLVEGNEGFHLGAVAGGGSEWLWLASPSGPLDGKGSFQTKRSGSALQYGGNVAWAHGRHIVYGYHGEGYPDLQTGLVGQANQFMHYDESGLFLGQFGQRSTRPSGPNQIGLSGNAFSPTLVHDAGRLYLYHNDESSHGGVHRWRFDGWDDVQQLRGRGATGSTILVR